MSPYNLGKIGRISMFQPDNDTANAKVSGIFYLLKVCNCASNHSKRPLTLSR